MYSGNFKTILTNSTQHVSLFAYESQISQPSTVTHSACLAQITISYLMLV